MTPEGHIVFLESLMEKETHWDAVGNTPEKRRKEKLSDERERLEDEVRVLVERLREIQNEGFLHRCFDIVRERHGIQEKLEVAERKLRIAMSSLEDFRQSLSDLPPLDDEEDES